ncbi:MAG: hypothetical protein AABZ64_12820 [Nitrospinota bacterium]
MASRPGEEDAAQALIGRAEEDEALLERLGAVCGRELGCLARPGLEGMEEILAEKEGLLRLLDERAREAQPLWERVGSGEGDPARLADLQRRVDRIRDGLERIQRLEAEIARGLGERRRELQGSFASLGRVGKAMDAYRPALRYAPRFLDRKE